MGVIKKSCLVLERSIEDVVEIIPDCLESEMIITEK